MRDALTRLVRRPLASCCAAGVVVGLGCSAVHPAGKSSPLAETLGGARAQQPAGLRKPGGVQPA